MLHLLCSISNNLNETNITSCSLSFMLNQFTLASPYINESAKRTEIFMRSFKENLKREAEKTNWPKV